MSTISLTRLSLENLHRYIHWKYFITKVYEKSVKNKFFEGRTFYLRQTYWRRECRLPSAPCFWQMDWLMGKWWDRTRAGTPSEQNTEDSREDKLQHVKETKGLAASAEQGKCTMTQVLVVLVFMVDIFTTACSFLSWSINDLFEPEATCGVTDG